LCCTTGGTCATHSLLGEGHPATAAAPAALGVNHCAAQGALSGACCVSEYHRLLRLMLVLLVLCCTTWHLHPSPTLNHLGCPTLGVALYEYAHHRHSVTSSPIQTTTHPVHLSMRLQVHHPGPPCLAPMPHLHNQPVGKSSTNGASSHTIPSDSMSGHRQLEWLAGLDMVHLLFIC
jgi:hypothetical protein